MSQNRPLDQEGLAKLNALREHFLEELPRRLNKIQLIIETISAGSTHHTLSATANQLRLLDDELHKLAGSAGTFGFPEITRRMQLVQSLVKTWFERGGEDDFSKRQQLLEALKTEIDISQVEEVSYKPAAQTFNSKAIHIIDDDFETAESLKLQIEKLGYLAQCFYSTSVYGDLFPTIETPALILMDMRFGNDFYAGADLTTFLKNHTSYVPPVAFISAYGDIESRLRALRTGAVRYIEKPELSLALPLLLEEFVDRLGSEPYKVLLIDDDLLVSEANRHCLEQTNLTVKIVDKPLETLEALKDFEPDVIVLDVIMPLANGFEIASILRENPALDPVPIIFLSADDNPESRLNAASLGGDDFLKKPCDQVLFTHIVLARARRSRRLKSLLAAAGRPAH